MHSSRTRGILAFLLFLLLAAPIEFDLAVYFGETQRALFSGVLYFFAVTISIESWMRIETHPELAPRLSIFFLKLLLWIPIGLFVLDFVPKRFGGNPAAMGLWKHQVRAAIFATLLALITHTVIDFANESLRKSREGE